MFAGQSDESGHTHVCAGYFSKSSSWSAPTCQMPTAKDLLGRYKDLTDSFSYPILTSSPKAQRLFDIVRVIALNDYITNCLFL